MSVSLLVFFCWCSFTGVSFVGVLLWVFVCGCSTVLFLVFFCLCSFICTLFSTSFCLSAFVGVALSVLFCRCYFCGVLLLMCQNCLRRMTSVLLTSGESHRPNGNLRERDSANSYSLPDWIIMAN